MSEVQISKNAIKRLGYVAGAPYIGSGAVELTLKLINAYVEEVSRVATIMMEYLNTKTIKSSLLEEMVKSDNTVFLKHTGPMMLDTERMKACTSIPVNYPATKGSDARLKYLLKKIKKAQDAWGTCYVIPRQTIVKMLKEKMDGDYRISKDALQNISAMIETFTVETLQGGVLIAEHAQRLKMNEDDVVVSLMVKGFPIQQFIK